MRFNLYYFCSEDAEREFVVISERPQAEVVAEFSNNATLSAVLAIDGDATILPCDRVLMKE